jgi:DMSO/TMAO reductase YedYZ molybdopterin-dependent catalytic subunit
VPGWYGVASVKWLVRIELVRNRPFEGPYQALDYRLKLPGERRARRGPDGVLPVSALLLSPVAGDRVSAGRVRASASPGGRRGRSPGAASRSADDLGPWRPPAC